MLFKKKPEPLFAVKDINAKLDAFHRAFVKEVRHQAKQTNTDKEILNLSIGVMKRYKEAQKSFFETLSKVTVKEN